MIESVQNISKKIVIKEAKLYKTEDEKVRVERKSFQSVVIS